MNQKTDRLSQQCQISLPDWVVPWLEDQRPQFSRDEDAMEFVISLAKENVRRGTGGPFSAAVVNQASGELVSVGINLVMGSRLSIAHAEMVAISLAQHSLGQWNLAEAGELSLISSCEPCAMCFGAIPWSGVCKLVCGGCKSDAEAAGFDEGEKPDDWAQSLRDRQIAVELEVLRHEAAGIFTLYRESGGEIYNAGNNK